MPLDLNDYIVFFEAEPTGIDPDVGWSCGAHFQSTRGEDRIAVKIAPDDAEFFFDWWQNEKLRASIRLTQVVEWDLECNPGKEMLRLKIHGDRRSHFILQLRPHISLQWVNP